MLITYTFYINGREYEYEYNADYSEVLDIIYAAIKTDGYNDITEELIDKYTELCYAEIKDYFCADAYEEWKDHKSYKDDPLGYYGFSIKDFI